MASDNSCDINITSDAYPSPPRPEKVAPEFNSGKVPKTSLPKHKKKPKKTSVTVVKNVFNISNCNGPHIGPSFTYNMAKYEKEEKQCERIQETAEIKKLLKRTDPITTNILLLVCHHVGKNWKVVAQILGYMDAEIEQFLINHLSEGIQEVIYKLLLDWKQSKPREAQVGNLFTALWKANEVCAIQKMLEGEM